MNLRTETGKSYFYQWDTNQILIVEGAPDCRQVHFCHRADENALVCSIREADGKRIADVPNILLQRDKPITAYLYNCAEDSAQTLQAWTFPVLGRPKQEGYIYTQTEVLSYQKLDERLNALEGEGLSKAVADYLEENPVQAGATAEEAAQIRQNKENIEKLDAEKLETSKLPEAINDALAQAKASGEFNGEDGTDGYSPIRGIDYWTDADKAEIKSYVDTAILGGAW